MVLGAALLGAALMGVLMLLRARDTQGDVQAELQRRFAWTGCTLELERGMANVNGYTNWNLRSANGGRPGGVLAFRGQVVSVSVFGLLRVPAPAADRPLPAMPADPEECAAAETAVSAIYAIWPDRPWRPGDLVVESVVALDSPSLRKQGIHEDAVTLSLPRGTIPGASRVFVAVRADRRLSYLAISELMPELKTRGPHG